jgi:FdhD protein
MESSYMADGTVIFQLALYDGEWEDIEAEVIEEQQLSIFVNGRELVALMCTPSNPVQLALGFLANEGLIKSMADVEICHVCRGGGCVDLWLGHSIWDKPRRRVITSGCSGGQTFRDLAASQTPVESDVRISPEQLGILLTRLQSRESLYARAGGVHASALSDGKELLVITEDIGRHNTLDRLRGECLLRGIEPTGLILLTSGRVSSEMINKAVQMSCPLVASRTSPTSLTVALARAWNITLCGYVRRNRMKVYAHPERLETPGTLESESNELQVQTAISKD